MTQEARLAPRFPVALAAELNHGGRTHSAGTRDISTSGVGLLLRNALPEGATIALKLFVTQDGIEDPDSDPLDVSSTVIWCAEQEDGSHAAGVRFGELNSAQTMRLERLVIDLGDAQEESTEQVA